METKFIKNLIKKDIILALVSSQFFLMGSLSAQCPPEIRQKVFEGNNVEAIIATAQVAAFSSDSLVTSGLDAKGFAYWQGLMACAHDYVNQQVATKKTAAAYKGYTADLSAITDYISATINYIKKNHTSLTKAQFSLLSSNVEDQLGKVQRIEAFALRSIVNAPTARFDTWKTMLPTDVNKIFPNYKDFFKKYDEAKKKTNSFAHYNSFMNFLKDNKFTTEKSVTTLANQLEQLAYRLNLDSNNASWYSDIFGTTTEKKTSSAKASEILGFILNAYPLLITSLFYDKLTSNQDKASKIIFSEAGALDSALKLILSGIKKLQESR